jgi:hypothetical protein
METTVTILTDPCIEGLRANIIVADPDNVNTGEWHGVIYGGTAALLHTGDEYGLVAADGRRGRIRISAHSEGVPATGAIMHFIGVGPFGRP